MKKLVNAFFTMTLFAVLSFGLASCGGDTCYECVGFDDGTTSLEDLGTICEGDDNGSGGEVTSEELEAAVAAYELFGGTCTKQ